MALFAVPAAWLLQTASWICHHHGMWIALLIAWLSNIVALFVAAWIVPEMGYGDDFWVLFIAALVFTLVNWLVRPLVILLALPAVIFTFGLALILINTFMLYLTDWIVPSFETGSFGWTLLAAIIVSIVNLVLGLLIKPDERRWSGLDAPSSGAR